MRKSPRNEVGSLTSRPGQTFLNGRGPLQQRLVRRSGHSAEIERIHKEVLDFERIEAISEPMRELIEDLWLELADSSRRNPIDSHGTHHAPDRAWPRRL
jgi:hypothetical protein